MIKKINKKQDYIYAIVCVRNLDETEKPTVCDAVGIFEDFNLAEKLVLQNAADMNEAGWYPHVVIEKLSLNSLYFIPKKDFVRLQKWYTWVGDDNGGYEPCEETPEHAKNIINWI